MLDRGDECVMQVSGGVGGASDHHSPMGNGSRSFPLLWRDRHGQARVVSWCHADVDYLPCAEHDEREGVRRANTVVNQCAIEGASEKG
jgi:hypothetical protein